MRREPQRRRARTVWSPRGQNATSVQGAPPELGCRRGPGDRQAGPALGVRTEERKTRLSVDKDAPLRVTRKGVPGTGVWLGRTAILLPCQGVRTAPGIVKGLALTQWRLRSVFKPRARVRVGRIRVVRRGKWGVLGVQINGSPVPFLQCEATDNRALLQNSRAYTPGVEAMVPNQ